MWCITETEKSFAHHTKLIFLCYLELLLFKGRRQFGTNKSCVSSKDIILVLIGYKLAGEAAEPQLVNLNIFHDCAKRVAEDLNAGLAIVPPYIEIKFAILISTFEIKHNTTKNI